MREIFNFGFLIADYLVPRLLPGNALSWRLCLPASSHNFRSRRSGEAEPRMQPVPRREPGNEISVVFIFSL